MFERDGAQLFDGIGVEVFTEREDCGVHHERVRVVEQGANEYQDVAYVIGVGELGQRFATHRDVLVAQGARPVLMTEQAAPVGGAKSEDPLAGVSCAQ